MDINSITISGGLASPCKLFETNNTIFSTFGLVTHLNAKSTYINALVFNMHLRQIVERFMIKSNQGKRACITGVLSGISTNDNKNEIQIVVQNIVFIDTFLDNNKLKEEKIAFDDEKLIDDKGIAND